jgi:hypothetical protein
MRFDASESESKNTSAMSGSLKKQQPDDAPGDTGKHQRAPLFRGRASLFAVGAVLWRIPRP